MDARIRSLASTELPRPTAPRLYTIDELPAVLAKSGKPQEEVERTISVLKAALQVMELSAEATPDQTRAGTQDGDAPGNRK